MKVYLSLSELHAQQVLAAIGKPPQAEERKLLGPTRLAEEEALDALRAALLDGLAPAREGRH